MKKDPTPLKQRFWDKANIGDDDDCWEWTGSKVGGYGQIRDEYRNMILAHRVSWMMIYGGIPDELQVLHKCDNPSCINPNHLFLGTTQDNMNDMVANGRAKGFPGESNSQAKLTADQVREIRRKYESGHCSCKSLAREYNMGKSSIIRIIKYQNWKQI